MMPDRVGQIWELAVRGGGMARVYVCLGLIRSKWIPRQDAYLMLPLEGKPEPIERTRYLFDDPMPPSPGIEQWSRIA
jgi:hypothetical protein